MRDFNYVDDVVSAMLLAVATPECFGRVFNLGSQNDVFAAAIRRMPCGSIASLSVGSVPFPDDKRIIDIGDYYGDFSRFQAATGWRPEVDLEEGLARTIAFYREHKDVYWK